MKKSLALAVGVAVASLGCVTASHAVTPTTVDYGTLESGYSNAFGGGKVSNPDWIVFTLSQPEYLQLSATISNTKLTLGTTALKLFEKGAHPFTTSPTSGTLIASDGFTKGSAWTAAIGSNYPGIELQAGDYRFDIQPPVPTTGNAAVGYSISVSGVPELSTWAMMLAGFGALGFAGYRRQTLSFTA